MSSGSIFLTVRPINCTPVGCLFQVLVEDVLQLSEPPRAEAAMVFSCACKKVFIFHIMSTAMATIYCVFKSGYFFLSVWT